ncbi:hypothetical protein BDV96DRAFT_627241 [Lophiotrema nucula]|uniref:BTB domain-containing protein n=1 Tax=Lophiotrema nucula TaxID=690887 RepID=A0A6A5ZSN0_9PLEO|nr:hypothetical protein BDV96DRAFT_627241 [Lophiotrema nucula]
MPPVKNARASKANAMIFDESTIVRVKVGKEPDQKTFLASEVVLTSKSEFFKRAMSGKWVESETRVVNLPNDDARVFGLWIHFAYTQQIPIMEVPSFLPWDQLNLQLLWTKNTTTLVDCTCSNAVVLAILALSQTKDSEKGWILPSKDTVKMIYEGTIEGNAARRLVVDIWVYARLGSVLAASDTLPKEFFRDISVKLMTKMDESSGRKNDIFTCNGSAYLEKLI